MKHSTRILNLFAQKISQSPGPHKSSALETLENTTTNCSAPDILIQVSVRKWTEVADSKLEEPHIQQDLANLYLPYNERTKVYSNGDVIVSSALWLHDPVEVVLESARYGKCSHRSEVHHDHGYADKVYYVQVGAGGDKPYPAVRYERPGVIRGLERRLVRCSENQETSSRPFGTTQNNAHTTEDKLPGLLLQQSVQCAKSFNAVFVALFDWNILVLLVFHDRGGETGAGDHAFATIATDPGNFRKALLGFLLLASRDIKEHHKIQDIQPPHYSRWESEYRALQQPHARPVASSAASQPPAGPPQPPLPGPRWGAFHLTQSTVLEAITPREHVHPRRMAQPQIGNPGALQLVQVN